MALAAQFVEFLRGQPVILLFLLLGAGYLLGRIKVAGIAFGPIAGTLLVSLLLGGYGFRITPAGQAIGFALFIFSVGYQAGPRFIEVVRAQGLRYFALALFVSAVGFTTCWFAGRVLSLPPGGNAGLLAGALTSTPTLAAAQEAVRAGLVALPQGWTAQQTIASVGACYAITYIVGTFGIIAAVSLFPRLIGLDLAAEARRLEKDPEQAGRQPLQARAYRVENPKFLQPTIAELAAKAWDGLSIVRIRRDLGWITPAPEQHLRLGDELHAFGYAQFFRGGIDRAGPEIEIHADFGGSMQLIDVIVARPSAVGRPLHELDLARRCGLVVCDVRRGGYSLAVTRDLTLQRSDVLAVVGPAWGIKEVPEILGPVERDAVATDMMTFALGIAAGAALGILSVTVAGVPVSLGMAGGLLVTGIAVGWLNAVRPTVGRFPDAARWILMEFGLLIFIAGVGLSSGADIVQTFHQAGPALIVAAVLVVSLPLGLGYLFGRRVLQLEPVVLLGALTGAMTSAPALTLVQREAQSPIPALGYTGTYALASILLAMAGTVLMKV